MKDAKLREMAESKAFYAAREKEYIIAENPSCSPMRSKYPTFSDYKEQTKK